MKMFSAFALVILFAHQPRAGEFKNLKEAITRGALAHIHAHPPKGKFTFVLCHDYKFENRRDVPEDVIEAILEGLKEDQKPRYISPEKFPYGQEFPALEEDPEGKIEFYFMGPFVYLNEHEVRVDVGYSWTRMKSHTNSYTIRKRNGEWICTAIEYHF